MGFSDTMKGLGRAIGGFLESAIDIAGPPLVQVGAQWLAQKAGVGGVGQYQTQYGTLPVPYGGQTPYYPGAAAPAYRPLPPPQRVPYAPAGQLPAPVPQTWSLSGLGPGYASPASAGGYAPAYDGGYTTAGWDIPGMVSSGLNYFAGGESMPAVVVPGTSGGGLGGELMERLRGAAGGLPTMFRYGGESVTAVRELQAVNPKTGKIGVWKYMGHPVLYSGDLATCKRVARISRRVARRRPR